MKTYRIAGYLLLVSLINSCVLPVQGTPPPDTLVPGFIYTQAVYTVQAQLTAAFYTPTITEPAFTGTPMEPIETPSLAETTQALITATPSPVVFTETADLPTTTATSTSVPPTDAPVTTDLGQSLGEPDFFDPFDSGSNWALTNDEHIQMQVKDGQMVLTAYNPGAYNGWGFSSAFLHNFYLEIHVTSGGQCAGRDRFGIVFRAPDASRGYLLGVDCEGEFALWYWNGDREISILNWTQSEVILKGPNQVNRLGINAQDDRLGIYANGILLQEIQDSTNLEGYFGLFIGAGQTIGFSVQIDSLEYWEYK